MTRLTRRLRSHGFTAVEMLVVVVILGIVAGIAIPGFQVIRINTALSSAQRDVVSAMQNARWRAITTGATHTINLASANVVTITTSGTTVVTLSLPQYFVSQTHTGGSSFDFDSRGLIPLGTTTPITITLTNPRSATRTIIVDRLGRITAS